MCRFLNLFDFGKIRNKFVRFGLFSLFSLILGFFILPGKVNALSLEYNPNHIDVYNSSGTWSGYADNCDTIYSNGSKFCGYQSVSTVRKVWFRYGNLPSSITPGVYDISGYASAFMPITGVTYGSDICEVSFIDDDHLEVSFICKNISIASSFSGFYVSTSYNTSFSGTSYMISSNLTFTPNYSSSTNQSVDNIKDSITSDDISSADDTASSFFDNFNTNDNGGISSIVTLPLRVIRGLISGENNCSALNFTLFDKEMYFPGGCLMWDEVSSANEILYQTIICGFFGYILLTMLFKDIEDLKNPNSEGVSTLDL